MNKRRFQGSMGALCAVLAGICLWTCVSMAQENIDPDKIPQPVADSLKAKFPQAKVDKCTKEQEGDIVIYDIEFKQGNRKFEADIKADGNIHNWEQAIAASDLPAVVRAAVDQRYPRAAFKEIMRINAVQNGKDELEGYEIVLDTADQQEVEVTIGPGGKILEDSLDPQAALGTTPHPLVGTWRKLKERQSRDGEWQDMPNEITMLKHITPTHVSWAVFRKDTNEILAAMGGRVQMDRENYTEVVEHGLGPILNLLGQRQPFTWKIAGNQFTQAGTLSNGAYLEEIFERVTPEK